MSASHALLSDNTKGVAVASPQRDADEAILIVDVAEMLGVSDVGARALANAGLLGSAVTSTVFARAAIEDLAERIYRAALPTTSDALGVHLCDAVEANCAGPALWPTAIAALLDGRVNAFRRRGAFAGRILAALVDSSERVVLDLMPPSEDTGEAPFIWTPTEGA